MSASIFATNTEIPASVTLIWRQSFQRLTPAAVPVAAVITTLIDNSSDLSAEQRVGEGVMRVHSTGLRKDIDASIEKIALSKFD